MLKNFLLLKFFVKKWESTLDLMSLYAFYFLSKIIIANESTSLLRDIFRTYLFSVAKSLISFKS